MMKYLDKDAIKGLEKYKYNSIDSSPLSNYVMHPFWNQLVKLFPRWIAPNVLTVTGFLLIVFNAGLLAYYDYDFSASSDIIKGTSPIPNWVWLVCAIFHFTSHSLDGIDGKQARRTGTSGPLGELMDHGLDSWAAFFLPFSIYSMFGRGELSYPPIRVLFIFWTIFITFYGSHWEKYNTGILYLPWSYDATQLALSVLYLVTYLHSYHVWKQMIPVFGGISLGQLFEYISYFGSFGLSVPFTVYNVYLAYKSNSLKRSVFEGLRPLISFVTLFVLTTVWALYSPTDVLNRDPRFFFCMVGTIFSQIACRLIINQMSSTRCQAFNWFLYPLTAAVVLCLSVDLFAKFEMEILRFLTIFFILAHVHYGVCITRQLCDHFQIYAFTIKNQYQNLPNKREK